ncbi:sensor histidine kinase [Amycolatopsis albispora]|uniref:Oxygen sensor histidine kinase NreB n=1 Tax=Amycolatopsis albispora TaxID=1804986 RepID=A0A344LKC6_9PSEU|nr:sensor histidine kinase [Amycolatopsis albispora]AXB48500.1 two-component sensor histidine kinase [Amycolatopsis albispora]
MQERPSWTGLSDDTPAQWAPWARRVELWFPYLMLGLCVAIQPISSSQPAGHQRTTLVLAGVALCWVALTDTLPRLRVPDNQWWPLLSLAGLLALASVLMARETLYLLFLIVGFFHALRLRPVWLMLLGLLTTSVLINSLAGGGPREALSESPEVFIPVVLVQTLAIAGGSLMGDKLMEQSAKRRETLEKLEAAMTENAGLHRQLLAQAREAGVLDERQRLSREIHDTLAQGFTGIITQLEAARNEPADRDRHLDLATALARENLAEARRAVHALRPEALDAAQLPDALRGVAGRWSDRTGVPIEFTTTGTVRPLHPEVEATLLRITQEALTNVDKHAAAGRAGLTLSYMEDQVTLDLRDDGRGFDPAGPRPDGYGLSGMRQRAERLAGSLHVESEPGAGTAISVNLPAITAVEDR